MRTVMEQGGHPQLLDFFLADYLGCGIGIFFAKRTSEPVSLIQNAKAVLKSRVCGRGVGKVGEASLV